MILLLDIGNTRIKWARLQGGKLGSRGSATHVDEQRDRALKQAFDGEAPARVLAANVAGPLMHKALTDLCQERQWARPEFFISTPEWGGVRNGYTDPARLGADRWAAVIGAFRHFGGPLCVVDAGTAITVDAVDAQGQHLGGLIAPGPQSMKRALADATAALRDLGEGEFTLLAHDTRSAVTSGGWHAAAGFLERILELMPEQLGPSARYLLTGGDAERLDGLLPGRFTLAPDLVLQGLAVVAEEPRP